MRYIDADALLRNTIYNPSHVPYITESDITFAPTADVQPVKRGQWIYGENDYDDSTYYCSVCGEPWTLITGTPRENNMHYCPNCGAKMEGEDSATD